MQEKSSEREVTEKEPIPGNDLPPLTEPKKDRVKSRATHPKIHSRNAPGLHEPSPGLMDGGDDPHSAKILWVNEQEGKNKSSGSEGVQLPVGTDHDPSNRGKWDRPPGGPDPPPVMKGVSLPAWLAEGVLN